MTTDPHSIKARTLNAIFLIILGYFGYSVADLCSKVLQQTYSLNQVLVMSGGTSLVISGLWVWIKHGTQAFFPDNLKLHLLRALFITGISYFMVRSLQTLPLADFYGIVFLTPFQAMILSVLILKEKVGWRRWCAAAVGFTGVLIIAGPQFNNIGEGVICALIGVIFAGANIITLRKIGPGVPIPLYGFYPFLLITIFNLIGMFLSGDVVMPRMEDATYLVIHGPITLLAIICVAMGFSRAPETSVVAPFMYTQIIWGITFGIIFFGAIPIETTFIGLALIIGAGLYSLHREYRLAHKV